MIKNIRLQLTIIVLQISAAQPTVRTVVQAARMPALGRVSSLSLLSCLIYSVCSLRCNNALFLAGSKRVWTNTSGRQSDLCILLCFRVLMEGEGAKGRGLVYADRGQGVVFVYEHIVMSIHHWYCRLNCWLFSRLVAK